MDAGTPAAPGSGYPPLEAVAAKFGGQDRGRESHFENERSQAWGEKCLGDTTFQTAQNYSVNARGEIGPIGLWHLGQMSDGG